MRLEALMCVVREYIVDQTGCTCYATYPPKDSKCFGSQAGDDYHKFIIFTQCFEVISSTGLPVKFYLYYRNKRTKTIPEFSSCEFGMFTGNNFTSLFKEHINVMSEKEFSALVTGKIIDIIKNI